MLNFVLQKCTLVQFVLHSEPQKNVSVYF